MKNKIPPEKVDILLNDLLNIFAPLAIKEDSSPVFGDVVHDVNSDPQPVKK